MEKVKNPLNKRVSHLTIRTIGESIGIKDLPFDITNTISNEVTYRIYQILQVCTKQSISNNFNKKPLSI